MTTGQILCTAHVSELYADTVVPSPATPNTPFKWNNGTVTYKLVNETGDIPDGALEHTCLNFAFTTWVLLIKDIRFQRVTGNTPADITVSFSKTDNYFTSPGILAYSYLPNPSQVGGVISVFNDDPLLRWSIDGKGIDAHIIDPIHYPTPNTGVLIATINLLQVMTHEMGHAIGLQHSQGTFDIMYPYYHNTFGASTTDIQNIQSLYEARGLSQKIIDNFTSILNRIKTTGKYP